MTWQPIILPDGQEFTIEYFLRKIGLENALAYPGEPFPAPQTIGSIQAWAVFTRPYYHWEFVYGYITYYPHPTDRSQNYFTWDVSFYSGWHRYYQANSTISWLYAWYMAKGGGDIGVFSICLNAGWPVNYHWTMYQTYDMRATIIIPYISKEITYDMDKFTLVFPIKTYKMKSRLVANPLPDYLMDGIAELDVSIEYDSDALVEGKELVTYRSRAYIQEDIQRTYEMGGIIMHDIIPDLERKWPQAFDLYFPHIVGKPYDSRTED